MTTNKKTIPVLKQIELPENVANALYSEFGYSLNNQINNEHELTVIQSFSLVKLQNDLFFKKVEVSDIVQEIIECLGINKIKAKKIALDVLGKKMLLLDTKWFEGEVSKKITELGGNVKDYKEITNKYIEEVVQETFYRELSEQKEKQAEEAEKLSLVEEIEAEAAVVKDPEGEKKAAIEIFSNKLKDLLYVNDYVLKIELNIRLITLLLQEMDEGELKSFHSNLLKAIKENQELITEQKINLKGELVEPTVANWVKNFIREVGLEGSQVNSLKKAKYLSSADNIQGLNENEKRAVGNLFFLYTALETFYILVEKSGIDDVLILQLTPEEQQELKQDVKKAEEEDDKQSKTKLNEAGESKPVDIMQLYLGRAEDREKIDTIKQQLSIDTRREYDKVADYLNENLKSRFKLNIIAAIELLAEIGSLDDLLAHDERYQAYMYGFFKRNNLQGEEIEFKKNPVQAKYVQYFLMFVFMERLGMNNDKAARLAANVSQIFMAQGVSQYAQLAYLDLNDHQFKWSDL